MQIAFIIAVVVGWHSFHLFLSTYTHAHNGIFVYIYLPIKACTSYIYSRAHYHLRLLALLHSNHVAFAFHVACIFYKCSPLITHNVYYSQTFLPFFISVVFNAFFRFNSFDWLSYENKFHLFARNLANTTFVVALHRDVGAKFFFLRFG